MTNKLMTAAEIRQRTGAEAEREWIIKTLEDICEKANDQEIPAYERLGYIKAAAAYRLETLGKPEWSRRIEARHA